MASPSSSTSPLQPEASTSTSPSSRTTAGRSPSSRAGGSGGKGGRSPASSPASTAHGPSATSPTSELSRAASSGSPSPSRGGHQSRQAGTGRVSGSPTSTSPSTSPASSTSPSSSSKRTSPGSTSTPTKPKTSTPSTHTPLSATPTEVPTETADLLSTPPGRSRSIAESSHSPSSTPPSLTLDPSANTASTSIASNPEASLTGVGSSSDSVADVDELLDDPGSSSPSHDRSSSGSPLKKVKVYELRNDSWFDRGTGHVHGLYDEGADQAILVVTAEEGSPDPDDPSTAGGFVKEDDDSAELNMEDRETIRTIRSKGVEGKILMHSHIQGKDVYQRQQDTLIVWTEPNGTDIALSFADPNDCENVWEFILEVQKMLDSSMEEDIFVTSSPPLGMRSLSPALGRGGRQRQMLHQPSVGRLDIASDQVKTLAKSMLGRERLAEAVIKEDYLKSMVETFEQAEDLEIIEALHTLFGMMQAILFLNDTTIIEFLLQEEFFISVLGMLEYDPEFPKLKASYRDFLRNSTRFRQAVEIKDESIRTKIHQTYRLLYLKDVVLARVLEESTMNIINSMIFFNQNDIVQHMQSNTQFLLAAFEAFVPDKTGASPKKKRSRSKGPLSVKRSSGGNWIDGDDEASDSAEDTEEDSPIGVVAGGKENAKPPLGEASSATLSASTSTAPINGHKHFPDSHKRDVVLLLHQLLLMSKNIQLPSRLQLVRTLLEHGLVYVLEWAFATRFNAASTPSVLVPSSSPPPAVPSSESDATIGPPAPGSAIPPPDADQIPNAAVEMLTHALDHDPSAVRSIVLAEFSRVEEGAKIGGPPGTTLLVEIVRLLSGARKDVAEDGTPMEVDAKDSALASKVENGAGDRRVTGFKSQLADALKQLLDTGEPDATFTRGPQKDGPVAESFLTYFYDNVIDDLMHPLSGLPDFHTLNGAPLILTPERAALLLSLCDLLSFFSANHGHRSQYFILSGNMNLKVGCLLNAREKPLRHAAIRFFRACLKINTHYMFRYLNKGDVFAPVLELLANASPRDNMLSSACLELFEFMRKENLKAILDHVMLHHEDRIRMLATRPLLKACFTGLISKWEQNNEPPPEPDFKAVEEDSKRRHDQNEDDYFLDSDEDTATPSALSSSFLSSSYTLPSTHSSTSLAQLGPKRKRQKGQQGDSKVPASVSTVDSSSASDAAPLTPRPKTPAHVGLGLGIGLGLGLADYGDDDEDEIMVPISDTSLLPSASTSTSTSTPTQLSLSSTTELPLPIPVGAPPPLPLTASGDIEQPMKEWKRRREDEAEEEEGSFLSGLIGGRGRGNKGHKRSSSVSSTPETAGAKTGRPLPATPGSSSAEGAGKEPGEAKPAEEGEKKSGGGFKFSLKPFKMGGSK